MRKKKARHAQSASQAKAMVLIPLYRQRVVENGKHKAQRKPSRRALLDAAHSLGGGPAL